MTESLPLVGTAATEQIGLEVVREAVSSMGFLYRDLPSLDFGIDGQIEIVESHSEGESYATGKIVSVQVKCGHSYFSNDNGNAWSVYMPKSTVNYWRSHSVPVLFVLVDPQRRRGYWTQGDSPNHHETEKGFRIDVPKDARFDKSVGESIKELAEFTTEEGRRLARLEVDLPIIATAVSANTVVVDITHWHNKSSGRMDFWIGVPGESSGGNGPSDIRAFTSGSVIGTSGSVETAAKFIVPWATPTLDHDFESEKAEELYDEYLAATGTWDSEDKVYIDSQGTFDDWIDRRRSSAEPLVYYSDAEISQYRMRLVPNELAKAFIAMRKYLNPSAQPPKPWPDKINEDPSTAG